MKKRTGVSSAAAAMVAGIPLPTLFAWATAGLVRPSIADASGRGSSRRFAFEDLAALRLLVLSRAFAITPSAMKKLLKRVQSMRLDAQSTTGAALVLRANGKLVEAPLKATDETATGDKTSGRRASSIADALRGSVISVVIDVDALVADTGAQELRMQMLMPRPAPKRGRRRAASGKEVPDATTKDEPPTRRASRSHERQESGRG